MKQLFKSLIYSVTALLISTSCNDSLLTVDESAETMSNEISFSTAVVSKAVGTTRSIEIPQGKGYGPLPYGYKLNIQMSHLSTDSKDVADGTALEYKIASKSAEGKAEVTEGTEGTASPGTHSTLTATGTALYWPNSTVAYGFTATAGTETIPADQTQDKDGNDLLIAADRLKGIAITKENFNEKEKGYTPDYQTAKVWYKNAKDETRNSAVVPLYLKHQCAMISIILEPSESVPFAKLQDGNVDGGTLSASIFSYGCEEKQDEGGNVTQAKIEDVEVTKPHHESTEITTTINGESTKDNTTKFTAIVEPHDYATSGNLITRIVIGGHKYAFYAANDDMNGKQEDDTQKKWKDNYNLEAGEHLEITVKVDNDRIIAVYAQQKDWVIASDNDIITDDFGNGNDPVLIHVGENPAEIVSGQNSLESFLTNKLQQTADDNGKITLSESKEEYKNAKGVIAILNQDITLTDKWAEKVGNNIELNATLNLNGFTIYTTKAVFNKIADTGMLKNGTICIKDDKSVDYAVASENAGSIEKIIIVGENGQEVATKAGLVELNSGEIRNCVNNLKVKGGTSSEDFIGGIAAKQVGDKAIIADCIVNSKVCTASTDNNTTTLGGIVGKAEGSVTGCTYEYGITLDQKGGKAMGNIVGAKGSGTLTASNNAWPTKNVNKTTSGTTDESVLGKDVNKYTDPYDDVIDTENELKTLCDDDKDDNKDDNKNSMHDGRYRIADSFDLASGWDPFKSSNKDKNYNMNGDLEGNNKTITTHGKMIFQNINKSVSNLTVMLNVIVQGTTTEATYACAALAKEVSGENAKIENVLVKTSNDSIYIVSPNPAGIVSIASKGATISNCSCDVSLHVKTDVESGFVYAGGIVSQFSESTIQNCKVGPNTKIIIDGVKENVEVRVGGIIGGVNIDTGNTSGYATSTITDNACFMETVNFPSGESKIFKGTIIGYYGKDDKYNKANTVGNWWKGDMAPVGEFGDSSYTFSPKNAIEPKFE